jgi:hypothetical protein
MVHRIPCLMALAFCILGMSCSDGSPPNDSDTSGGAATSVDRQVPAEHANPIEGLWSGSWGGGESGGVVMQPVVAELVIQGDSIEMWGFPKLDRLTGVVQIDTNAGELRILPAKPDDQQPVDEALVCPYRLDGDMLQLVVGETEVTLQSQGVAREPSANPVVELLAISGSNEAGDLLVKDYAMRRTVRDGAPFFALRERTLTTKDATVLLVDQDGAREISLDEARSRAGRPQRVAIIYRQPEPVVARSSHTLWREAGTLEPDGEAARQTYSDTLRPGTLVFVLPHRESIPRP